MKYAVVVLNVNMQFRSRHNRVKVTSTNKAGRNRPSDETNKRHFHTVIHTLSTQLSTYKYVDNNVERMWITMWKYHDTGSFPLRGSAERERDFYFFYCAFYEAKGGKCVDRNAIRKNRSFY